MPYSQSWLEDSTSIRGILIELTVKTISTIVTTAGGFTIGTSYVIKTIGSTNFTSIGASASPYVGETFIATGVGTGSGTGNLTTEAPVYLSNIGYVTADSSISYLPVISGGVQFTESLPLDGQPAISFGDIAVNNSTGELDVWLDNTQYVWANRAIQIYLGDPSWISQDLTDIHTQFEKIFDGVIADVDSVDTDTLNIKIRDKLDRLNVPLTDTKLGTIGTWGAGQSNADVIRPVIFGEVFNFTPLLIDPSQLEYMFCKDSSELLIELRDNGVPIFTHNGTTAVLSSGATVTLNTGRFKLTTNLVGTLTASAQGVNNSINLSTGAVVTGTYVNNIANLIALITRQYGVNKLTANELDLVNLLAFSTTHTQSVGILVQDTSSVLSVCQQLANSIGAQVFMNRNGKLQLLRIGSNTSDAVVNITQDHILNQSLSIANRTMVSASKTVAFNRNWTVQPNLLTNIYPEDKSNFSTEYYTRTALDQAVQTNYKLPATDTVDKIDTLLLVQSEAVTEAARLNTLYTIPRTVYKFTGTSGLLNLKLGQGVTLTHPRFNLTTATAGQVVTLSPNWLTSTIDVEVLV